jgi:L-methionine (R)-S-oxide reductase
MDTKKKAGRYSRIYTQLEDLMKRSDIREARMATVLAVLSHKMEYFFWTGFYLLVDGTMTVWMYQGPVACQVLEKNKGVCWAAFNRKNFLVVDDVNQFPGHIACDARSRSEIAVPFRNENGEIIGVLDVDSRQPAAFDQTDALWLEKIIDLIHTTDNLSST